MSCRVGVWRGEGVTTATGVGGDTEAVLLFLSDRASGQRPSSAASKSAVLMAARVGFDGGIAGWGVMRGEL